MSIEKYIRVGIVIIAAVLLAYLQTVDIIVPKLYLETKELTLVVNSKFNGIKYEAYLNNKNITNEVLISGTVDTTKIGDYKITYLIKNKSFITKKELIIHVIDNIKPKIALEKQDNICDIKKYIYDNVKAYDNYDGDISDKITFKLEDNTILFEVADSSGNIGTKEIDIDFNINNPSIKLKGDNEIYLKLGDEYKEYGATALDACNNDISENIKIIKNIDFNKVGKYEVIYMVTDNNNLTSEVRRVVNIYDEESTPGFIYLTFDDGPGEYTNQILDILNKYNIKATFFVTKRGDDNTILREYNEGHTIGLHTYSHEWKIYNSEDTYYDDLNKIKDRVKNITGMDAKYIRFPGGSSNTISRSYSKNIMSKLTKSVENNGYSYFDWNVSVEDAGACAKKRVKNKEECVLNYFKDGIKKNQTNFVLLHDVKEYTANALEDMINYAIDNNYKFYKINEFTIPQHHDVSN